ncbi:MAG: protein kinase [Myxococcales bacterium]
MQLGTLIAQKYRLERLLGEGGMGAVYHAVNVVTGKGVAIKCLHADLSQSEEHPARFLREAQAAARIDHPNVVNVFDVGRHDDTLFLVMELLQGETLAARIDRGPQDPTGFIQLMLPALRGVHAAHRSGVTHRDLKPDNIFLCRGPDGEVREAKVLDFGISKIGEELAGGHSRKQLTLDGAVFGTPQYMAPEQIRSARLADARSDVYALGVIFYRALSGEFPFDSETLPGLALRIVEGNPVPLQELCPELDPQIAEIVTKAMALDPKERFQTVAAFGEALEPFSEGYTFATSPGGSWVEMTGEHAVSSPGHIRTPATNRRTPASRPRGKTPVPATPQLQQGEHAAEAAVTGPAHSSWNRLRRPALGSLAFLLGAGALVLWFAGQPNREDPMGGINEAPALPELADVPAGKAGPSEPAAPTALAPVAPSEGNVAPLVPKPEAALPADAGALGAASPEATAPAQALGAPSSEPGALNPAAPAAPAGSDKRTARRKDGRSSGREASEPAGKPVAAPTPATAPAAPEPAPKASAGGSLLQNTDGNPYLRH